jgi:hypothetical protein
MINYFCCTKDNDIIRDSMLDVGPKVRNSFIQDDPKATTSLKRDRKNRKVTRFRAIDLPRKTFGSEAS